MKFEVNIPFLFSLHGYIMRGKKAFLENLKSEEFPFINKGDKREKAIK